MKAAPRTLSRLLRDAFRVEPLEPRILLSADPVLGAAAAVVQPREEQAAALLEAYAPKADLVVSTTPGQTVLVTNGPARNAQAGWLVVDASQLNGGNGTLVIGGPGSNARILLGEEGGPALKLHDLVLLNPADGGEVYLNAKLELSGELVTVGSGHTFNLNSDQTMTSASVNDSVVVAGNRTLTAQTADIQLGASAGTFLITGDGVAGDDKLTLRANGNVAIYNAIGGADPLEGLYVTAQTLAGTDFPDSVTFYSTVTLNGDLWIDTGTNATVTFKNVVTLTGAGSVKIIGSGTVSFEAGLVLGASNATIEANEIDFTGSSESITGTGVLTLRPATKTNAIELGSLGGPTLNVLNLTNTDLGKLADGFSRIVIGHDDGSHALTGTGAVTIGAGAAPNPLVRDALEVYGNSISVEDPTASADNLIVLGTIKLDAVNDITIKSALYARGPLGTGVSNVTLWSRDGAVRQMNSTEGNEDVLTQSEAIRADLLTVRAATGITLPFTEVVSISATNTGSNAVTITETATGGDVAIVLLSQAANAANLSLSTTNGSITVNNIATGSGVLHAGTGLIDLSAAGGLSRGITVNQAIASTGGAIRLTATGAIATNDDGATTDGTVVTGAAAALELNAGTTVTQNSLLSSAGGEVKVYAGSSLLMGAGTSTRSLDASGNTGIVRLKGTTGNVTVANVEADGQIHVNAGAAILVLSASDPNLDGETAAVLLAATSGIGSSGINLKTRVASLAASNTGSNGIFVREASSLALANNTDVATGYAVYSAGSNGAVVIVAAEGTLTVGGSVQSSGAVGNIRLQAAETDELATTANLAVNASVSSTSGSISLLAGDDLTVGAGVAISTAGNAAQSIDVAADRGVAMAANSMIGAAGGGKVWLAGGTGEVTAAVLNAGAGQVSVSAGTDLLDAGADDAAPGLNITGATVRLAATAGSIGAAGALLDISAGTLATRSAGGTWLRETNAVDIGSVSAPTLSRVGTDGVLAGTATGYADLSGLDSGGVLVLDAGGNVGIAQQVKAAGNLRLTAGGTMTVGANVTTTGGHASLVSVGRLQANTTEIAVQGAGKTLDLASTADQLYLSENAKATTNGGNIHVAAGISAWLSTVDARTAADRLAGVLDHQADWGDVSVMGSGAIGGNTLVATPFVYARELRLEAAGIGSDLVNFRFEASRLGAMSPNASGSMFLHDVSALALGTTGTIGANRVGADGGAGTLVSDAALAGLSTLTGTEGAIFLRTGGTLSGGAAATVVAGGNILLRAAGGTSDLDLDGTVRSALGHVSLDAGRHLLLDGNVQADASGKTVDLLAVGNITLAQGRSVLANGGNVSIDAGGVVTLELVAAGAGSVRIAGSAIVDGDGAADGEIDVIANGLLLKATAGGIGAAGAVLETNVSTLSANATGGGVYLREANGATVGSLQVNVQRVRTDTGSDATTYLAQEDLSGTAVFLASDTGNLLVQAGATAGTAVTATAGAVRIEATAGTLQVEGSVDAGANSLSLIGAGLVTLGVTDAITLAGGTVDLESTGAALNLASNAVVRTNGGNIRAKAAGAIQLSVLDARTAGDRAIPGSVADQANWGHVSVRAGGSVSDYTDTDVNVHANQLRLEAGAAGGLGASGNAIETEAVLLSAKAGTGGAYLDERTALQIGQTSAFTVARPDADGTVPGTPGSVGDTLQNGIDSGGVATVVAGGQLQTSQGIQAAGNLLLTSGNGGNLSAGALVRSTGGHLMLQSAGNLALNGNVETVGGTLALYAAGSITQAQTFAATTGGGNLAAVAGTTLTVETMNAGAGAMHLAGTTVFDGDTAGDTETDLTAASLRILAAGAIGEFDDAIETDTATLAARAAAGVFLSELNGVTVGAVGNVQVQQVAAGGGATGFNHTGGTGLDGTNVVLQAGGLLTLDGGSATAAGNLLLQSGAGTSLVIKAGHTASATGGSMSLVAGDEVAVQGTVAVLGGTGTLDVRGARADLAQNSVVSTAGGDVSIVVAGTATIESIDAGTGGVRISANRVQDGDTADSEVDIVAARVAIAAAQNIGATGNTLEIDAQAGSFRATASVVNVSAAHNLSLDTVTVTVNQVNAAGAAVPQAGATQSDNTGTSVVVRANGNVTTTAAGGAVTASTGNLLLEAMGAGSDLTVGAAVNATLGSITLKAADELALNAAVSTAANGATIDVQAGGNLVQAQGANSITTNSGHVSVESTGGSVTIERIAAGAGRVHLAGTSILDGDTTPNDGEVDVLAAGVLFTATNGSIGASLNAIETTTSAISAVALQGGAVFIAETDALNFDTVAFSVNRIQPNATGTPLYGGSQSGVSGSNVAVTAGGALAVLAGNAVEAAGNLLLQAGGAGDLTVGAQVRSTAGAMSLVAGGSLLLNANVLDTWAGAGGSIDLRAGGAFTQAQNTAVTSAAGNVGVAAGGAATVVRLEATAGDVRVVATSITDGDGSDDADVIGGAVKLQATAGAIGGASLAALDVAAATLAAKATGNIFLSEADAVHVGSVAVNVRNVDATGAGTVQAVADTALAGLDGATVVLQTVNGLLAIDAAASVVAAGNLLLSAGGSGSDLSLGASVSAAGAMSLAANRNVSVASTVSTTGGAASTMTVHANGGTLSAAEGSSFATTNADVLLFATGTLTIDGVNAGTGRVRLEGAAIVDGDTAASETEVDVVASQLQVASAGAVGSAANALETTVGTLSVSAGGAVMLAETDALAIDATTVAVTLVAASGTSGGTVTSMQSDVTSTAQGNIAITAGGAIDLPANADIRTGGAATIFLKSATGHVLMHATTPGQSQVETGSGDIRVQAEGDIRPGALLTTGHAYLDSANGSILVAGDLQRDGEDIDLLGDDLAITVPVESDGATLRIGPLTTGTAVVIGGPGGSGLHVDGTELGLLQEGFAQIVIGSNLAGQSVQIDGAGATVTFLDPVVLVATGAGGNISIEGGLQAETLTVQDSGASTTLVNAAITTTGAVNIQDQVAVNGATTITGNGITFTKTIQGVGGTDSLVLDAQGGNVSVTQAVGNLDSLTIGDAVDVTFSDDVTVDGVLEITATGTITFTGELVLGATGKLVVKGGGTVVFASTANVGQDASLEVANLQATGGAASITGTGTLAISGGTAATAIHLGIGAGAGGLVIGATALSALGDGFDTIRFGSGFGAGAGTVTVGEADLRNTDAKIQFQGSTIAIATTGAGLQVDTDVALRANGAITTSGAVTAYATAAFTLQSDTGAITMAAGSSIASEGGAIGLKAAGALQVGVLDARAAGGGAGSVVLESTAGTIADAGGNTGVDVFAQSVDFNADGPGAGDVLEVAAPIVRVNHTGGLLLRETGADGRSYYGILQGGTTRQVLVGVGTSVRVNTDPANYVGDAGLLADMGLDSPLEPSVFSSSTLWASQLSSSLGGEPSGSAAAYGAPAALGATGTQVGSYLAGARSMVAPELSLSERLLADSSLSFASGQSADVESSVDWWLETIAL